jgi:Ca2+-binding RTX toxin-like protein
MATYNFTDAVIVQNTVTPCIIYSGVSITITDNNTDNDVNFPINAPIQQTITVNSFATNVNGGVTGTPAALNTSYATAGPGFSGVGTGTMLDNSGNVIQGRFIRCQNASALPTDDFLIFIPSQPNTGFTSSTANAGLISSPTQVQYPMVPSRAKAMMSSRSATPGDTTVRNWSMGTGNDTASEGADTISGGNGNDCLVGLAGADSLSGGNDQDSLSGGTGDDSLSGDAGNDTLTGGNDRDLFFGGAGDLIDGSEGGDNFDTLDIFGSGFTKANTNILYGGGRRARPAVPLGRHDGLAAAPDADRDPRNRDAGRRA